ncbi:MAG: YcxB family protein [Cellulosilyticaceae bacterium]
MYNYEFKLTEEAYIACYQGHLQHSAVTRRVMMICRVLSPIVIMSAGYGITNKFENVVGLIIFGIPALIWLIFFPKFYMKSMRKVSKRLLREGNDQTLYDQHVVTIGEQGISENIPAHGITKQWHHVSKTIEDDQYLFLYVTSQEAVILPKAVIGDAQALEVLKQYIDETIKKEKE